MSTVTHYFLGANSGRGFQNLFDRFARPEDHYDLAIIKGGPGMGKSTLMRRIGEAMAKQGEDVEFFHCSGDPDSLDGVYIPRLRTAMLDGTPPHVLEPKYPAAAERIINLGRFCQLEKAKAARAAIVAHSQANHEAYQQAYQAFGAARQLDGSARTLMEEALDREKLLRRTDGILGRELRGRGSGGESSFRFLGSLTCQGPVWRFDTVTALCPKVYQIQDSYGLAYPMLERIRAAAAARDFQCVLCLDPEHPDRLHHLLIPELGLGFVTSREDMLYQGPSYRRVRIDALVSAAHYKRYKTRLRFLARMSAALRREGIEALQEAKAVHDELEADYHPCMDFAGVEETAAEELRRIEGYARRR